MGTTEHVGAKPAVTLAPEEADLPIQLWQKYDGLTESAFFHEFLTRLTSGRDMRAYVTAAGETGVGKTQLAIAICLICDVHGWTPEKGTLSAREYSAIYDEVPPGSWLLLDEAEEALDKRRGMTDEIIDVGHDFMTKRYKQIFGLMTLPTKKWMDTRVADDAADYWIQCLETDQGKPKGEARVYRLQNNEHYETTMTKKTETISWPNLDGHPTVKAMNQKKRDRKEGDAAEKYVPVEEYEDAKSNFWEKAMAKARFEFVRAAYTETDLKQAEVARITQAADGIDGITQRTVSNYLSADSFEEWYA